jgi:hypothetical protein
MLASCNLRLVFLYSNAGGREFFFLVNEMFDEVECVTSDFAHLLLLGLHEPAKYEIRGVLFLAMFVGNTHTNARKALAQVGDEALDAVIACV